MSEIKAVAFDKDGTIFDSERLYADSLVTACDELGYDMSRVENDRFFGLAADATFALLAEYIGPKFEHDKMLETWMNHRNKLIEARGVPMMPGAEEALRYCYEQGYPLALVTSDSRDGFLHDFSHAPEDLQGMFSVVITVEEVAQPKPDPEPYLRAAAYLGVLPQELLVVEDSTHGIESALAAGCPVAVFPSTAMPEALTERASKILNRIDEIKVLL